MLKTTDPDLNRLVLSLRQGGHKPEKHGNLEISGNLKNCQNLREV